MIETLFQILLIVLYNGSIIQILLINLYYGNNNRSIFFYVFPSLHNFYVFHDTYIYFSLDMEKTVHCFILKIYQIHKRSTGSRVCHLLLLVSVYQVETSPPHFFSQQLFFFKFTYKKMNYHEDGPYPFGSM